MATVYRATIICGGRSFSEELDAKEERESFDESNADEDTPSKGTTWDRYTRRIDKVSDKQLAALHGKHILCHWSEHIHQVDYSPSFALTEFNKAKGFTYKFERFERGK